MSERVSAVTELIVSDLDIDFSAHGVSLYGLVCEGSTARQIDAISVQKMALILIEKGANPDSLCRSNVLTTPLHIALNIGLSAGNVCKQTFLISCLGPPK